MSTQSISLGADPEWTVLDTTKKILRIIQTQNTPDGQIGWDHSGYVREIRPRPSFYVGVLVRRIRALIKTAEQSAPIPTEGVWLARPYIAGAGDRDFVTCGGHVHIGKNAFSDGVLTVNRFREAMDRLYVAFCAANFWPQLLVELRATSTPYGNATNALRLHGRAPTVEYRMFPTWLNHPWTTRAVLTATKLVVQNPHRADELKPSWFGVCKWFEHYAPRFAGSLPEQPPSCDDDLRSAWAL